MSSRPGPGRTSGELVSRNDLAGNGPRKVLCRVGDRPIDRGCDVEQAPGTDRRRVDVELGARLDEQLLDLIRGQRRAGLEQQRRGTGNDRSRLRRAATTEHAIADDEPSE